MVTSFNEFLNEGQTEVNEIYLLADQIIEFFAKRNDKFYKEIKEDGYIEDYLVKMVFNPSKYKTLIPFISQFDLLIQFNKDENRNIKGEFSMNSDTYEPSASIIINTNNKWFESNIEMGYDKYKDNEYEILKYGLSKTFRSSIAHELQHAYDYFRSEGKFSKSKQSAEFYKQVNKDNILDGFSPEAEKMYNNLPHEQWARFTETMEELVFDGGFKDVLNQFKDKYRNFNALSEKDKNRLIKALYVYYDNKKGG